MNNYLSARYVARVLAVSHRHVLRLIRDGEIRAINVARGPVPIYRIAPEALQDYLVAKTVGENDPIYHRPKKTS